MEDDQGGFVPQFLEILNSPAEFVNPINLYQSLVREHLNVLDFDYVMTRYQNAELYLDGFDHSPRITGPGCPYFNFLQPQIAEFQRISGCQRCNYEDNITARNVSRSPYFIQQLDDIPVDSDLVTAFAARFEEVGLEQPYNANDPLLCLNCQSPRTKTDFLELLEPSPVVVISIPR